MSASDRGAPDIASRIRATLADLGAAFRARLPREIGQLWFMTNGYAFCTRTSLAAIAQLLESSSSEQIDALRGHLRIGLHQDVELTDAAKPLPTVSQAFCSADVVDHASSCRRRSQSQPFVHRSRLQDFRVGAPTPT